MAYPSARSSAPSLARRRTWHTLTAGYSVARRLRRTAPSPCWHSEVACRPARRAIVYALGPPDVTWRRRRSQFCARIAYCQGPAVPRHRLDCGDVAGSCTRGNRAGTRRTRSSSLVKLRLRAAWRRGCTKRRNTRRRNRHLLQQTSRQTWRRLLRLLRSSYPCTLSSHFRLYQRNRQRLLRRTILRPAQTTMASSSALTPPRVLQAAGHPVTKRRATRSQALRCPPGLREGLPVGGALCCRRLLL